MPRVTSGMKCPLCKAPTDVVDTRLIDGEYIRKRECFNEHVFKTREMAITEPAPKTKAARDLFTALTKRIGK